MSRRARVECKRVRSPIVDPRETGNVGGGAFSGRIGSESDENALMTGCDTRYGGVCQACSAFFAVQHALHVKTQLSAGNLLPGQLLRVSDIRVLRENGF